MSIRTPNTFIVGAGPVATALAGALRRGGIPVLGLWARDPAAARQAAQVAGVASYSAAPPDLLLEADAVIVAVRDDAIAEVAQTLLTTGLVTGRHVLLHCSGAISAQEAFAAVRERVGGVATLHPLRALADGRTGMQALPGSAFGVEGDDVGRAQAMALVEAIGGRALRLSGEQMVAYHAAAALASNYAVALLDAAASLLKMAGIAGPDAVEALVPLVRGSLDNVAAHGIAEGLTGPIRRGDRDTVARHLELVAGDPELATLYRVLGRRALALARQIDSADAADLDAMERLLSDRSTAPGVEPRVRRAEMAQNS